MDNKYQGRDYRLPMPSRSPEEYEIPGTDAYVRKKRSEIITAGMILAITGTLTVGTIMYQEGEFKITEPVVETVDTTLTQDSLDIRVQSTITDR